MTTREQYAVASIRAVTLGVQVSADDPTSPSADDVYRGVAIMYAHAVNPDAVDPAYVERYVRTMWPGRAFWFEVGDGDSWVQVVEYGAFSGKPHKAHRAGP